MKDEYKRRHEAERLVSKTLPGIEPSLIVTATHEERLISTFEGIKCVSVQGNELIATSNSNWGLSMYTLDDDVECEEVSSVDDPSTITDMSEDEQISNERRPIWRRVPTSSFFITVTFISKDIIACTEEDGNISTWCARSAQRLDYMDLRRVKLSWAVTKVTDTEFVIGSQEGHLCFFSHKDGLELTETKRIWKAHSRAVFHVAVCGDKLVSASLDWSARLWDMKSKKRLATFHHDGQVYRVDISHRYILTCSRIGVFDSSTERELRIFVNEDGYALVKIFRVEDMGLPRFIKNDLVMYARSDEFSGHSYVVFFELESECILGELKIGGIRDRIQTYDFLDDGRLVVGTDGSGCRGVISTLPEYLRTLIVPEGSDKSRQVKKRRFCTIV